MKQFDLIESNIPAELTFNLMEHHDMIWVADRTPGFYRVFFFTIAEILKSKKSKNNPKVGFMLKDKNGDMKFGAILMYHAPDDGVDDGDDDKGNFTLEFTLDSADMTDLDIVIDNHSDLFIQCASRKASDIMYGRFVNMEYCNNLFIEAIDTLVKFMDANASETEEVSVIYKGVFTATVAVEGGEKIISIVPGEMVKQFIKGDTTL